MPVQGQTCFKPEGVPRTKSDGVRALVDQQVPDVGCIGAVREQFETEGLSGVSRACDQHFFTLNGADAEVVAHGFRKGSGIHDLLKNIFGGRSLEAQHGNVFGFILHGDIFKFRQV